MAKSVNAAFDEFLREKVNIPSIVSERARSSRDFLLDQIKKLSSSGRFFELDTTNNCYFGSFARKTKICVLDDIDIIICMNGNSLVWSGNQWDNIYLKLNAPYNNNYYKYSDSLNSYGGEFILNSTKVKNRLLSGLNTVSQYEHADFHSRGEAVTLKLKSYDWNFDIVPAFYYEGDNFNTSCYFIPNGKGNWKKTNPIVEQKRISSINQEFDGIVLEIVRLIKYWNRHGKMHNITSYVLETMVVDYFTETNLYYNQEIGYYISDVFWYIHKHILFDIYDAKNIQGNINDLSIADRQLLSSRAYEDFIKASDAVNAQQLEHDERKAINIWRSIFGDEFPTYG